jgi:hypothetical protein
MAYGSRVVGHAHAYALATEQSRIASITHRYIRLQVLNCIYIWPLPPPKAIFVETCRVGN